jgi:inhibitor of KinA
MSIPHIIDRVASYQYEVDVTSSLPLSIIPICYDKAFALDYRTLERFCKLDFEEIITLHLNAEYKVVMFGFMPGFPYLHGLPLSLAVPRLKSPRKIIPKGSVSIANEMCGIYPNQSPGGWNIIGRSPLTLFDPLKDNAMPLKLGQRVKFQQISKKDFDGFAPN